MPHPSTSILLLAAALGLPGAAAIAAPRETKVDAAAGTASAAAPKTFELQNSETARDAKGATASKIKATKTHAAVRFFVVDKEKGPVPGVVISLTAPDGSKIYTDETDAAGYAEALVPVGQKYELVYLSLGSRDIATSVALTDEPNQNVKLTLRYKRPAPAPKIMAAAAPDAPRFVLIGVNFDTAKATIRPESFPRLDRVVEFMSYKKSARVEISGHTDNVGNPKANKALSEARARACRDYLVAKGIPAARITAVGFGDERPIASNATDEGRQLNRRIEAKEL